MTLDPQLQAILDAMAARGAPPMWTMPHAEARAMAEAGFSAMRGAGVEEVAHVVDRVVPGRGGDIPVRVYRPEGFGPFGVLVWFHGGGFVIGSVEGSDQLCRALCNRGRCVVVSVEYRLAPEHPFPAAVDDTWDALCWAQDHAAEIGGDPLRVAVGGDSAGANLAAVAALTHRDASRRPPLKLQLLAYPGVDRRGGYESVDDPDRAVILPKPLRQWFHAAYLPAGTDVTDHRVSPMCADSHEGVAPAYVMTAGYDPLHDEGNAYAVVLDAAGVATSLRCYETLVHGFLTYAPFVDAARTALDDAGAALAKALA
jgi:acetyl esterase